MGILHSVLAGWWGAISLGAQPGLYECDDMHIQLWRRKYEGNEGTEMRPPVGTESSTTNSVSSASQSTLNKWAELKKYSLKFECKLKTSLQLKC